MCCSLVNNLQASLIIFIIIFSIRRRLFLLTICVSGDGRGANVWVHAGVLHSSGWTGWGPERGPGSPGVWEAHPDSEEVQREWKEADGEVQRAECRDRVQLHQSVSCSATVPGWSDHHNLPQEGQFHRTLVACVLRWSFSGHVWDSVFSLLYLQELDKAWKMVDAANDKEKRDKDTIRNLKDEIATVLKQAEQSVPPAEEEWM